MSYQHRDAKSALILIKARQKSVMADLTIRGLPDELHAFLRQRAEANHRSVNREMIVLIERAMRGEANTRPRPSADEILAMGRRFADLPVRDPGHPDELIGYAASGLPK
ncbi:MAG: Arc family DNA-binding protein [Gemmatimonadales bacterium]|nr:Arc family DNA-binding protein [Gemmatimonadales bacterium]